MGGRRSPDGGGGVSAGAEARAAGGQHDLYGLRGRVQRSASISGSGASAGAVFRADVADGHDGGRGV